MIHTTYEWMLDGKMQIFARSWVPEGEIVGVINLVHGLGEHSGRYERWAALFASRGWGVLATDLPGNGRSEGKRGHVRNYQIFMDQIDLMVRKSGEYFPGKPRILYGHSMGGNLVINYAISRDPDVSALLASSPWLKLVIPIPPLQLTVLKFTNALFPSLSAKWPKNPENLTHDPEIWAMVREDPLNHGYISVRLLIEVRQYGLHALSNVHRINKPFLLMHGSGDQIASHKASQDFVANTSERTKFKLWEGLRHELHNEFEYLEIFDYAIGWIESLALK